MKKIALITSGGDAPGMNAAIRAVVRMAIYNKLEVIGIRRGFRGLIEDQYFKMDLRSVSGIINRGGTILKTGRCKEIRTPQGMNHAIKLLKKLKVDGIVVIGGDGSLCASSKISASGIPVVCIPGSIDNDIYGTDETIGFDTAIDTALEAIDKIRDTALSHERVFVVEIMGREHGFLTLAVGLGSGCEFVLIPEKKIDLKKVCAEIGKFRKGGKTSIIIAFAEGAGNVRDFAENIEKLTGLEVRVSSLGYIQRGGSPSARSRILACRFGAYAVEKLLSGASNRLVVLRGNKVTDISFEEALKNEKYIDEELYKLSQRLAI
jgi:6-phosphofructokinase 1